jgi:hypothetical protein
MIWDCYVLGHECVAKRPLVELPNYSVEHLESWCSTKERMEAPPNSLSRSISSLSQRAV